MCAYFFHTYYLRILLISSIPLFSTPRLIKRNFLPPPSQTHSHKNEKEPLASFSRFPHFLSNRECDAATLPPSFSFFAAPGNEMQTASPPSYPSTAISALIADVVAIKNCDNEDLLSCSFPFYGTQPSKAILFSTQS